MHSRKIELLVHHYSFSIANIDVIHTDAVRQTMVRNMTPTAFVRGSFGAIWEWDIV
jgi:hypothetical protein